MIIKSEVIEERILKSEKFESNFSSGLSSSQVDIRIKEELTNKTKKHVNKSYAEIIFTNLFSFFNILLLTIGIVMAIANLWKDMLFLVILFANMFFGLYNDIKARRLVDKLRIVSSPKVKVIRDGNQKEIRSEEVVFGDYIVLDTGSQISADGVVEDGTISVNESMLTGESINIAKHVGESVYAASYATSGHAIIKVNKVGSANYAETLQKKAKAFTRPKSNILQSMNVLFMVIGIIVVVIGITSVAIPFFKGEFSTYESFVKSIGYISGSLVSMIPSGMYLLTSMTLSVGVINLSYRHMLVQELYCIETLARVDTLCLDKTGTLTDGTMNVHSIDLLGNVSKIEIKRYIATLLRATKDENMTAKAMNKLCENEITYSFVESISFSSERKYSAVYIEGVGSFIVGALNFFNIKNKREIEDKVAAYSKRGFRVLVAGIGNKKFKKEEFVGEATPVALIIIQDHIKDDAKENIQWFKDNGVTIKVISGDNAVTVSEISKLVGVEGAENYVSLENVSLEETKDLASKHNVFGRVSPEQKEVLIQSLRDAKHIVAMTGDGVNDILALKRADCSIAMANGSDAAKNVSHLVSQDSNFSALPKVVEEGRRVINNLQRTCTLFLSKTIFAIVLSLVFLIGNFFNFGNYPFKTSNMYVWEILSIGLAAFFLALEPNKEKLKGSFIVNIIVKAFPAGLIQIVIVAVTFLLCHSLQGVVGNNPDWISVATTMSIIGFSIMSLVVLLRTCWPLNRFRTILYSIIFLVTVLLFLIDMLTTLDLFSVNYNDLNVTSILILIIILLLAIPLYFWIDNKIRRYAIKKTAKGEITS